MHSLQKPATPTARRYNTNVKCRVRGNGSLIPILDLGMQALTGGFRAANEPDPPIDPSLSEDELDYICDTSIRILDQLKAA